ncbi:hypothetical protein [Salinarimonas rosea]|uniref:hypothetical protein n=1 Tax=Salinarimonas rosea TaxID=552063 RepID=UPI00048BBD7E|nr:hypothetical protein [Salinarimonas rosea]
METTAGMRTGAAARLLVGPGLVAGFTLLSAVRDVFLSDRLQAEPPLVVAALAFAVTNLAFGPFLLRAVRAKREALRGAGRLALGVNASTAAAWLLYFAALANSPPAIVITIWSAAGPLAAAWLVTRAKPGEAIGAGARIGPRERLAYGLQFLLALGLALGTGGVALAGGDGPVMLVGNLCALASGLAITVSVLQSQALALRGLAPAEIMGLRFQLTGALAVVGVLVAGPPLATLLDERLVAVAGLVAALIVLPNFVLQIGVVRTNAVTAKIILSFAPSLTFALQTLVLGIAPTTATAVAVGLFFALAVAGALARAARA